ncbi:unnamed protein product, partial [Rotaria sordida]
ADGYTVRFLSNEQTHTNDFIVSQKFYRKFQEPTTFSIAGESDTYTKVTGFTAAFSHSEPLLYKIKLDAICHNPNGAIWMFPRIMVNDYLIYNDKLIQNTADRYKSIPGYTDIHSFDHIGVGQYAFFTTIATTITKTELIYLQPGLHVIDVAARAEGTMPVHIYQGVLTIELVRFRNGANVGEMTPINVTSINSNG